MRELLQRIIGMLILVALAGVLGPTGCSDDDNPESATTPNLTHAPLNLTGPYNAGNQTYGSISFIPGSPAFKPFGVSLGVDTYLKRMSYYTVPEAPIVAVSNGIVSAIIENPIDEGDYEVHVTSIPGSDFTIVYDWVQRVAVQEDLAVLPGDTIGYAGYYNDDLGKFSLQITTGESSTQRWYCPLIYGDDNFVAEHDALLDQYTALNRSPHYDSLCLQQILGPDY
ncbi:MAG: hypothetical protein R3F48_14930 [Candidatus Zixiibacteriota bacterium]